MREGYREVKATVAESEVGAFLEHIDAFKRSDTDAQRAAEIRAQDESNGLDSLNRLFELAHGDSGQCRHVARFLLGLYNGTRFPFDLTDFRCVDASIFEDMLRVLRMDSRPKCEVHNYFKDGGRRFETLANDWNLHKSEWRVADRGFSIQRQGYLCFIEPVARADMILWAWSVQSGGGWAWRGGEEVVTHAKGEAWSVDSADAAIRDWFERGGETPHED